MTRFARASGSKSSNEKCAEDSTPWHLMKQQVIQGEQNSEQEYDTNWKSVLDTEKKIEENKKSVWCEFEKPKVKDKNINTIKKFKSSDKTHKSVDTDQSLITDSPVGKNKFKQTSQDEILSLANSNTEDNHSIADKKSKIKNSKNKSYFDVKESSKVETLNSEKQCKSSIMMDTANNSDDEKSEISSNDNLENNKLIESSGKRSFSKNHKRKNNESNESEEDNFSKEIASGDLSLNESYKTIADNSDIRHMNRNNTATWQKHNKSERPYKRRKVDEGDVKLEINGLEIWVTRLDGFYIKTEDAERIKQLEKDLLSRGVSKQEVRGVIKKERRNAEKSLARLKKKVCFNCRKGGHTLSACPKLMDNGAQVVGNGICYKCGSTEHTHFQCKVNSGQSYKFATCFICKQEGHISRQCPDNPRGIYPTGGGCRLCGDVTHFRRECPTLQKKSNKITVGFIDEDIETLDDKPERPVFKNTNNKKQNKIVKFN